MSRAVGIGVILAAILVIAVLVGFWVRRGPTVTPMDEAIQKVMQWTPPGSNTPLMGSVTLSLTMRGDAPGLWEAVKSSDKWIVSFTYTRTHRGGPQARPEQIVARWQLDSVGKVTPLNDEAKALSQPPRMPVR